MKLAVRGIELPFLDRENGDGSPNAQMVSISAGGFCLSCNTPFPEGAAVRCDLSPGKLNLAIPVLIQVCWTRELQDHKGFRIGVRFLL